MLGTSGSLRNRPARLGHDAAAAGREGLAALGLGLARFARREPASPAVQPPAVRRRSHDLEGVQRIVFRAESSCAWSFCSSWDWAHWRAWGTGSMRLGLPAFQEVRDYGYGSDGMQSAREAMSISDPDLHRRALRPLRPAAGGGRGHRRHVRTRERHLGQPHRRPRSTDRKSSRARSWGPSGGCDSRWGPAARLAHRPVLRRRASDRLRRWRSSSRRSTWPSSPCSERTSRSASRSSARAISGTIAVLVFLNGGYLFCCIPMMIGSGPGSGASSLRGNHATHRDLRPLLLPGSRWLLPPQLSRDTGVHPDRHREPGILRLDGGGLYQGCLNRFEIEDDRPRGEYLRSPRNVSRAGIVFCGRGRTE